MTRSSLVATFAVCLLAIRAALGASEPAPAVGSAGASRARVVLIGPRASTDPLGQRISDLWTDGPMEVMRAESWRPEALFAVEATGPDTAGVTAWVIVGESRLEVRVAGARRDRFVFRDLAVADPLGELDLERAGQTVKAGLRAVGEVGPSVLTRAAAEAALGVRAPTPTAPVAPVPAAATPPPPAVQIEDAISWRIGAFLQAADPGHLVHGPGVAAFLRIGRLPGPPGLWGSVHYQLPDDIHFAPFTYSLSVWGVSLRAGVDLELWPKVSVGVGAGLDHIYTFLSGEQPTLVTNGASRQHYWVRVGRILVRLGPVSLVGIPGSLTLFLDSATNPVRRFGPEGELMYRQDRLRPGLAFELWFR